MDFGQILEMGKGLFESQEAQGFDLNSIISTAQNGPLGDVVNSWLGNGENMPISADQVSQLLGNEKVAALASQFGVNSGDLSGILQNVLPGLIDKASADGKLLDNLSSGDMLSQLAGQFLNRG
jgi:uncharacterized protein YidB (DUF937 family)